MTKVQYSTGLPGCLQIARLEAALTARHTSLLGFCHNDLQYGNMLLHTAAPRSLSFSFDGPCAAGARGGSPRGGSPARRSRGCSPDLDGCA